jgi:hypothetical protein
MHFRALFLLLLCFAAPVTQAQGAVSTAEPLQAVLLYNFASYTEWPSLPEEKIKFCVMGSEALLESLGRLKNRTIKGRALEVKAINSALQAGSCQVVFFGWDAHPRIHEISLVTRSTPVLLVAEENDFDPSDVVISLRLEEGRYSFKINQTGARNRALVLSSNLLKLAAQVN